MQLSLDVVQNVGGEWLVILEEKENGAFVCLFSDGQKIMNLVEEQLDWSSHKYIDAHDPWVKATLAQKQREVALRWVETQRRPMSRAS